MILILNLEKKYRHNHGYSAAILIDLSKAFDTINLNRLFAKLHAYGVSKYAFNLMMSHLRNRYQLTNEEIFTGDP